jgi:uroporphyrinogen-III decarboxylase
MKSRREQVRAAIRMRGPEYAPLYFVNRDKEMSDIVMVDVVRHFMGGMRDLSEWGFRWERRDQTMGQPREPLIREWADLAAFRPPDPDDPARFEEVVPTRERYGDRYYCASLVLSGFTLMSFLRGFSPLLADLHAERERVEELADMVFGFEEAVISRLPGQGFDGVSFYDDWGTQSGLIVSPSLWREFWKPRYRRQFDLAHGQGLDVYFHCCGAVAELIPDLIECGVDMLNLGQPNLFDIEELGRRFGGRVCFVMPVSYQTTSISGTREDIFRVVRSYGQHLAGPTGGLIGYIEEYGSIGLSEENYQACIEAFRDIGAGRWPSPR